MSIVSLEECERIIFHAKQSKAENFLEKIKNKGPKIHYFLLKLYTWASKLYSWASKSGGQGGPGPPPPPGSASALCTTYLVRITDCYSKVKGPGKKVHRIHTLRFYLI